ncbi:entericidin A/B family lipoprotein [Guyparkeria halophila]|uniref:Entericidin A/B family lipoprotein n=1 Tax=Guyparkeria halophila TaxID=47960 RepID=A0ABZ0Z0I6_9GAMM|nr:entericidin A/B family lipoprotein [Guyparkeria halophila]WQH17012.1 entericidin A/B family lipoprotein [Guyparkeria halophila]
MMITTLKRMSLLVILAGPLAFLSGCNTMEGLGQDTEELGESIESEAEEHD